MKLNNILKQAIRNNYAFWICLLVSLFLIIGGAIVPPPFIIDKSIFIAVGELFAFGALGALIAGMDKGLDARITHNNTSLEIGDLSKKEDDCDEDYQAPPKDEDFE